MEVNQNGPLLLLVILEGAAPDVVLGNTGLPNCRIFQKKKFQNILIYPALVVRGPGGGPVRKGGGSVGGGHHLGAVLKKIIF